MGRSMEEMQVADVDVFVRHVAPHYAPSENPAAMCVGAATLDEAWVVREFHRRQYGIQKARVAACNVLELPESPFRASYDFKAFNRFMGDARTDFPYIDGVIELEAEKYDLVYIRNPDLINQGEWAHIFQRALQWTRPEGALATLVIDLDLGKYERLLDILKREGIKPAFSGPTGVKAEWKEQLFPGDYHHTLGVFKPAPF